MTRKTSGILLHITSLPNKFCIGDLGPCAYEFVDFLSKSGFSWWQMLPIGPTGKANSPYQSPSAFAGSELLISPELLLNEKFIKQSDLKPLESRNTGKTHFNKAKKTKAHLLKKSFEKFEAMRSPSQEEKFKKFIKKEEFWLHDYALFSVLQKKEKNADWTQWSEPLKHREADAMLNAASKFHTEIRYYQFVQWQFSIQWEKLTQYCKKKNVKLIGDIPMFLHHKSHDVWANQSLFKLQKNGLPKVEAGVPGDRHVKKGQLWQMPVYQWGAHKKQHYQWWIERVKIHIRRFDEVRLDHFIGFIRAFEIPFQAKSAKYGHYRPCKGPDFFKVLKTEISNFPFIAEDLGRMTKKVERLRDKLKLPGTEILQYDLNRLLKIGKSKKITYHKSAVLYTSTHDHKTLLGWFNGLNTLQQKILCLLFKTNKKNVHFDLIQSALNTKVHIVIMQMQDILGLDNNARMNIPGTEYGNWKWRLKNDLLTDELAKKFKQINR